METERLKPASIIKNNPKIDKTITFTNVTQDLTRRPKTSLGNLKKVRQGIYLSLEQWR